MSSIGMEHMSINMLNLDGENNVVCRRYDSNVSVLHTNTIEYIQDNLILNVSNKSNFICKTCGKEFNTKAHLKQHNNKKYKCGETDIQTNASELLDLNAQYLTCRQQMLLVEKENLMLKSKINAIALIINQV